MVVSKSKFQNSDDKSLRVGKYGLAAEVELELRRDILLQRVSNMTDALHANLADASA